MQYPELQAVLFTETSLLQTEQFISNTIYLQLKIVSFAQELRNIYYIDLKKITVQILSLTLFTHTLPSAIQNCLAQHRNCRKNYRKSTTNIIVIKT